MSYRILNLLDFGWIFSCHTSCITSCVLDFCYTNCRNSMLNKYAPQLVCIMELGHSSPFYSVSCQEITVKTHQRCSTGERSNIITWILEVTVSTAHLNTMGFFIPHHFTSIFTFVGIKKLKRAFLPRAPVEYVQPRIISRPENRKWADRGVLLET